MRVLESFPEQVMLAIKSESGDGICAQVITQKEFETIVQASERAVSRATFNDSAVSLKLIEIEK